VSYIKGLISWGDDILEKVKLPKEVAKAIERFRNIGCDNASIIYTFASGKDENNLDFANYASDNFDTLLQALVNGYEVEQTPEDKVREYYNITKDRFLRETDPEVKLSFEYELIGIQTTINKLGIKIEGIN
jgi:hypothetical protein